MRDNYLWDKLAEHFGHDVRISVYGDVDDLADVCLECEDCNEVILDAELYTLRARSGIEPELPIEKALEVLKSDLKALNSSVAVEQEEYDEVMAIKPMFLIREYQ